MNLPPMPENKTVQLDISNPSKTEVTREACFLQSDVDAGHEGLPPSCFNGSGKSSISTSTKIPLSVWVKSMYLSPVVSFWLHRFPRNLLDNYVQFTWFSFYALHPNCLRAFFVCYLVLAMNALVTFMPSNHLAACRYWSYFCSTGIGTQAHFVSQIHGLCLHWSGGGVRLSR